MFPSERLQLGDGVVVKGIGPSYIVYEWSLHGFSRCIEEGLPVSYCCIEDLVHDVLYHLCDEFLLNSCELLRRVVVGRCCELTFEVVGVFLVVDKADVDGHLELHLTTVAFARDAFIKLVEGNNLACELEVAVLFDLPQLCLIQIYICYPVLEDALHRCPNIGASDGEVVYLDGFGCGIVDACPVEAIADGAGCDEQSKQKQ